MAVLLALAASAAFGISDFLAGVYSRQWDTWQVAVMNEVGAIGTLIVAVIVVPGHPQPMDWIVAATAGMFTGLGIVLLFRGLKRGRIAVVAPVSALGSALVPVVAGLIGGDRPHSIALLGLGLALPATALISSTPPIRLRRSSHEVPPSSPSGLVDGVGAGLALGALLTLLSHLSPDAGWAPLALGQVVALTLIVAVAGLSRAAWRPTRPATWRAVVVGVLNISANMLFVTASLRGMLSVVAVITALYPASTVLLAALILKERIYTRQALGLLLAAGAVGMVALG